MRGQDALEVGVEVFAQRHVTAVVNVERRLNEGTCTDFAEDALQHLLTVLGERLCGGVVGEVVIVFVHEAAGAESSLY